MSEESANVQYSESMQMNIASETDCMNLDEKIEFWKNRLLDLSRRNRLIHSPIPNTGKRVSRISLHIQNPDAAKLWKRFADDGDSLIFPLSNAEEDGEEAEDISLNHGGIPTNQTSQDTQKTLQNLKQKTRTFTEEKGLHALHLAFCFLCWREGGDSGQECRSHVVLHCCLYQSSYRKNTSSLLVFYHAMMMKLSPIMPYLKKYYMNLISNYQNIIMRLDSLNILIAFKRFALQLNPNGMCRLT